VIPARRRRVVEHIRRELGDTEISERRACAVLGQARSTQRYEVRRKGDEARLVREMNELARRHPRYGYRRVTSLIRDTGWRVNLKRVHRLWKREGLKVSRRRRKRRRWYLGTSANSCDRKPALGPNHVWTYDFIDDRLENGGRIRILSVVDEYTRQCLALDVRRQFRAEDVVEVLRRLVELHGAPTFMRSDNGPEFIAEEVREWLRTSEIDTLYIEKGSPWENGYVESFHSRLRDELLNRELFLSLAEAKFIIRRWQEEYNGIRPHSSLGYLPPAVFAGRCAPSGFAPLRPPGHSETASCGGLLS
jgi:transposase InsO family protein